MSTKVVGVNYHFDFIINYFKIIHFANLQTFDAFSLHFKNLFRFQFVKFFNSNIN